MIPLTPDRRLSPYQDAYRAALVARCRLDDPKSRAACIRANEELLAAVTRLRKLDAALARTRAEGGWRP